MLAGEPCIGARHVQQCMWTGRNRPDAAVPLHAAHYQMLLTSKVQKWQDDNSFNPYLTTSQACDDCMNPVINCALNLMFMVIACHKHIAQIAPTLGGP